MPEITTARRIGVLDEVPEIVRPGFSVVAAPTAGRLVCRVALPDVINAAGFDLGGPINQTSAVRERLAVRLGPDEWLIVVGEAELDAVAAEISAALAGRLFTLTDISHRHTAFEVSGSAVSDVLSAGCPLDLERTAPGFGTRTLLGKAEVVLIRLDDAPDGSSRYRVECWRSFGRYLHAFLAEAAGAARLA